MLEELRHTLCQANLDLVKHGLVTLTWGNVSAIDRPSGLVVIKPSGVSYNTMTPADMVITDLHGNVVEGALRPSSDLPTHLAFYRAWPTIGGVVHTHSPHATAFAQACREIPCFGTTHADHFYGSIPLTRGLTPAEVDAGYELSTGTVVIERFQNLDPTHMPAVLVANHGPFAWGPNAAKAVENAVALEAVAKMALDTLHLNPATPPIPGHILNKHFNRKHGPNAYYGQN
jgi:L-ribulose-5-phosphate 4-epimerase